MFVSMWARRMRSVDGAVLIEEKGRSLGIDAAFAMLGFTTGSLLSASLFEGGGSGKGESGLISCLRDNRCHSPCRVSRRAIPTRRERVRVTGQNHPGDRARLEADNAVVFVPRSEPLFQSMGCVGASSVVLVLDTYLTPTSSCSASQA
jgi:hypothetical protein